MGEEDQFKAVLASLSAAMVDARVWPETAPLINEICDTKYIALMVGEGPPGEVAARFVGFYGDGLRMREVEREYIDVYHPIDERVPRLRKLPDSRVVHITELYLDQELKTSPTYNEFHRRVGGQDSLNVRFDGLGGSHISWSLGDPVPGAGWGSAQIAMVNRVLPHVRQLARVRQSLGRAGTTGRSLTELLEASRVGIIHLDRRGRVIDANGLADEFLSLGDGLATREGTLTANSHAERLHLGRLLKNALPEDDSVAVGGSMVFWTAACRPRLIVHITPVSPAEVDFGGDRVRAMVVVFEPGRRLGIGSESVAMALGLTPAQSRVAVLLAEGKTVQEIARATERKESSIYSLLKQTYRKLGISRQVDLVRLVSGL